MDPRNKGTYVATRLFSHKEAERKVPRFSWLLVVTVSLGMLCR